MKASDVMTRRVIAVARDASILQAMRLLLQNGIRGPREPPALLHP